MALIRCPECDHHLSDQADLCPHCGYPLVRTPQGRRSVQVIEKTAKRWKRMRVFGWVLMASGGAALFPAWAAAHSTTAWVASLIGSAGVACVGISRAGAWWYHG